MPLRALSTPAMKYAVMDHRHGRRRGHLDHFSHARQGDTQPRAAAVYKTTCRLSQMMRFKQVQSARDAQDGRAQGTEPTMLDAFHREQGVSWRNPPRP